MSLREDFYEACFVRENLTYSDGVTRGNNKLNADYVKLFPELRERVSDAVASIAEEYKPDTVLAIPNGANWLAIDVACRLGTTAVLLDKDLETKAFSTDGTTDRTIEAADRIVIVDDIFREFTNTRRALALPGVGEKAVAAVAIADRGNPDTRIDLGIPHQAVITEYIAPMLSCSSPLWRFAS